MKTYRLKKKSIPKLAVLVTGLTAAILAATISPQAAHAYSSDPPLSSCASCHSGDVITPGTTATAPTTTLAPGASYDVTVTPVANPAGGMSGYSIVPVAPATGSTNATGTAPFTATMTAPATAGTYTYNVYTVQGKPGTAGSATYVITVAGAGAVATATTLAVSPASPATVGVTPTLTANVTGTGTPAGTVTFFNGATALGAATAVSAAGVATKTLTALFASNNSYKAVFTPTDATAFASSTSSAVDFVVTPATAAVNTTTVLAVSPTTGVAPADATLTATVTGAGAAGTVQFLNGPTTVLGTSPVDAAGIATMALTGVGIGTKIYHAVFIPTDATAFAPSTSSDLTFKVLAPVQVTTTTALAMTPTAATAVAPTAKTLNATVTGANAAGLVEFFNGTTSLGTSPVDAAGIATKILTSIPAGSYSYTAKFIPTNAALFTPSTSTAVAFVVTVPVQVTTTTALAMTPTAATAVAPTAKTLNANVTGANAAGLVEFFNGTTSLGTSPVDAAGIATKILTAIPAGSYSYTAVFTPTNAALFTPSTSNNLAFVVTVPPTTTPPVTTTTPPVTTTTPPVTTAPKAPTGVKAIPGNGLAVVSWNASAGATSYTLTASPGGRSVTTSGTTATVTGLTNGTSYTFTVIASNAAGTSLVSTASTAVIPSVSAVLAADPGVVPVGSPDTGAGGASQSGGSPLVGLGGLALLLAGAATVPAIRRRRRA